MELHEEWSVADNDDVVLMGLYWLCSFCHGKISEGFRYPKSSLQDLAQRDGIRLPPQHSHENWKVVDDDKGILEIQSREDYHDLLGERFLMGFYDGIKLEEPYFIDFGEDYELTLKRYRVNVREKITSSSAYQAVLENPPESSESGEALQIEHILKGVIPDEGLECYKTGVMYGRHWYYRYYGDNFAFDFHLAYIEGEGERPCWMSNEENYVLHDGVYFARPLLGDQGYSKEQILHFSTVFVRKYGDFPPLHTIRSRVEDSLGDGKY